MTKPPRESRPKTPTTLRQVASAKERGKPVTGKQTMLDRLLMNSNAYDNDEIKVWVRTNRTDWTEEFMNSMVDYLEELDLIRFHQEVVEASEAAPLPDGQHFITFSLSKPDFIRMQMGRVTPRISPITFRGLSFVVYGDRQEYDGLRIGPTRPYLAAAKRCLAETGGEDWFGGIAEFVEKFLEQPKLKKKSLH